jgi:hypothetical protein
METKQTDRYRIVKVWRCGVRRWLVLLGDTEVARFALKREAIDWIMKQEFHSNTEAL